MGPLRRLGWLLQLLLVLAPLQNLPAAEQRPELRSIYTVPSDGVYVLFGKLVFDLPEGARQAIRDGATLNLSLEIAIRHTRRFWLDETIAILEQRYAVMYHAVSERYLVRNVNSGAQTSFSSLDMALASLNSIQGLPILDTALVAPEQMNEVSVRASLEIRSLPTALGILLFWVNDWRQTSDWYTWTLRP